MKNLIFMNYFIKYNNVNRIKQFKINQKNMNLNQKLNEDFQNLKIIIDNIEAK